MRDGYGIRYHRHRALGVPWHKALFTALPARLLVLLALVRDKPIAYRLHIHGVIVIDEPQLMFAYTQVHPGRIHHPNFLETPSGEKGLLN